jgi:hypothetical protein
MATRAVVAALRTKQFQALQAAGLRLVSTDRQLANGTIALAGKFKVGRKTVTPTYSITANGAVISNEYVARRVDTYRDGLTAVAEILEKRLAA